MKIIKELNTGIFNQGQLAPDAIVPSPHKRGNDVLVEIGSISVELPKEDDHSPKTPSVVSYNLLVTKCVLKCNICYRRM